MHFVVGLVDHVPREDLAPVMSHNRLDVVLENLGQFAGSEFSFRQPLGNLPVPHERVPANLHSVPDREIDNLVRWKKVERFSPRMHHLPLERVLGFHHVELAGERGSVRRLGKLRRPYRGADQHSSPLCRLPERRLGGRGAQSQARDCDR
jgi:hypothetical protein